jgi:hypothetical protein
MLEQKELLLRTLELLRSSWCIPVILYFLAVLPELPFSSFASWKVPFFPHLELYVRVLGFWGIWLFTIPSHRSRKPGGAWGMSAPEKRALDAALLLTPLANLAVPAISKDFPVRSVDT